MSELQQLSGVQQLSFLRDQLIQIRITGIHLTPEKVRAIRTIEALIKKLERKPSL